jgi:alkanesulfonate monooxygenase SsuD/methylene tetrahydromethanopterin reductase-like flavin-dependent oxidoreductase (luciferase family)
VARHAEELGFHSVQLPHIPILPYPEDRPPTGGIASFIPPRYRHYQYDPIVLLPMMAQATKTIRIGFNILVTPYLHPFVWAKYLATLDAATGGRVVAGFGLGHAPPKGVVKGLTQLGIESARRGDMSDEALEIMVKLWTSDEPVTFPGKFYTNVDLMVDPKPVQKPYPELWWAGDTERSIVRAARYATYLEVLWPPAGRVKDFFGPQLQAENAKWGGRARLADLIFAEVLTRPVSRDEIAARYHIGYREGALAVGSPEQCADVIRRLRDAGIEHFALDMHRHGRDPVSVLHEQMDMFVKEVLPLL